MHILILPSEEFVPKHAPMLGIFQLDQAKILHDAGFKVGVVSVNLQYSLPMILRSALFKLVGKKCGNKTDQFSFSQLFGLLFRKLFNPGSFTHIDNSYGFPVYRAEGFYILPPNQKHDYKWWRKAAIRAVRKYIEDNGKPDVMHTHTALPAGLAAQIINSKYNLRYWIIEHSSFFARGLYHPSLLPLANEANKNADRVFTVSDFLGRGMQQIFPDFEYEVFPNTVDPIIEETLPAVNKNLEFSFISIGSLIPLKRHYLLIRAFSRAFSNNENVRLYIIGRGSEEENLKNEVERLSESERVLMTGELSKRQILKELDKCHVLCHVSDYETFGVAVLEAQFRGLPAIATRCGGPEEIITTNTGYLVEKDDEEALIKGLRQIKDNYERFDASFIRNYAIETFGREAFLRRVNRFMSDLRNNNSE